MRRGALNPHALDEGPFRLSEERRKDRVLAQTILTNVGISKPRHVPAARAAKKGC